MSDNNSKEAMQNIPNDPQQLDLRHAFARSALGVKLSYVDWALNNSDPEWWVLDQPKIRINNHILLPDLAGWQHEQLPAQSEQAVIECIPDWIGEVLSSSAEKNERVVKMPLYAKLGVKSLWVVNPNLRTLQTYQLDRHNAQDGLDWRLVASYKEDDKVNEAPFDSIIFPLNNLWQN